MAAPLVWTRARPGKYTCYQWGFVIRRGDGYKQPWHAFSYGTGGRKEIGYFHSLAEAKEAVQAHHDRGQAER